MTNLNLVKIWRTIGAMTDIPHLPWIKKLRERGGITQEREGFPLDLFGVASWPELLALVDVALRSQAPSREKSALMNALGIKDVDDPLAPVYDTASVIERRRKWARGNGLSVRTVERLEEVAALQLAAVIDAMSAERWASFEVVRIRQQIERLKWWAQWRGIDVPEDAWPTLDKLPEAWQKL
jgi:hypothetical protein